MSFRTERQRSEESLELAFHPVRLTGRYWIISSIFINGLGFEHVSTCFSYQAVNSFMADGQAEQLRIENVHRFNAIVDLQDDDE